jgi:hypothetical protein
VVLQRGRPVTGVVRDARTKAPIAGALVDVGLERGDLNFYLSEEAGAVSSDSQGRYRLPAVDTSSTWIFASAPNYARAAQPLSGNSADFELRPAGKLIVKVVDAKGAPARRAFPIAKGPGDEMARMRPDFEHEGTFMTEALAPGSWTISIYGDGATYRSQTVTVAEAPVHVTMSEATDGVTVEVKITGDSESAVLMPGVLSSPAQLRQVTDFIQLKQGIGRNVLPGPWTVVLFKRTSSGEGEASLQPIEVKESGNPVWTITPQWQPVPRQR